MGDGGFLSDNNYIDHITEEIVSMLGDRRKSIINAEDKIRKERENIAAEVESLKKKRQGILSQIEQLRLQDKQVRLNLFEIGDTRNYSEEDFIEAYERCCALQRHLGAMAEKEALLKKKIDELFSYLKKLDDDLEQSQQIIPRLGVSLDYLSGRLNETEKQGGEHTQRQSLGLKIILAQEEERRRVAREIHDGPAQSMANLVLRTEICEKIIDSKPGEVKEELRELKTMVRNSLQEIRKIIFDLRPMALDDLGLIVTLKRFVEDFREKNSLHIDFSSSGDMGRGNKDLEIAVFRIIQEALNNVVKHADASEVVVIVGIEADCINVTVRDNGRGFNPAKKHPDGSYGLMGIKERVGLLEGDLDIYSGIGKGTELKVRVPIKKREN